MKRLTLFAALMAAFLPSSAFACACGCGVFDVGTGTMMPTSEGGQVWFEYDAMNQQTNWHHGSRATQDNNGDKMLTSDFFQFGGQYMFNRSWGAMVQLPFVHRFFKSADEDTGDILHNDHAALGDLHVQAVYAGFEDDMSTGVTFGFKLPTGDFSHPGFDRDVQIGSGSVDTLLGGYHMGALDEKGTFDWFANALWDHAIVTQGNYRPGDEIEAAVGTYYNDLVFNNGSKLSPLLQLIGSWRFRDSMANANPADTGYKRLMISPGLEYDVGQVKLYGDIELPVYQFVNGNQIVAPIYGKFVVGYKF